MLASETRSRSSLALVAIGCDRMRRKARDEHEQAEREEQAGECHQPSLEPGRHGEVRESVPRTEEIGQHRKRGRRTWFVLAGDGPEHPDEKTQRGPDEDGEENGQRHQDGDDEREEPGDGTHQVRPQGRTSHQTGQCREADDAEGEDR